MKSKKLLYIDLETININLNEEVFVYPIMCGIYGTVRGKEIIKKQWWVKLPYKSKIKYIWSETLWKKYKTIPVVKKLTIDQTIKILNIFVDNGWIFRGWNIKNFDLKALEKFGFKKMECSIEDSLLAIREFRKKFPNRLSGLTNNKADTVFKFLSKTILKEEHLALSDCLVEAFIDRHLSKNFGKSFNSFLEKQVNNGGK